MHHLRACIFGAAFILAGCSNSQPSQPVAATAPPAAPAGPYENVLVRRPGATPEDGKVYVVQNGKKHWVVNASWFTGHGFKFPDDVHQIPVSEFDAIPSGDPIQ
jgi:hypothetical protein